MNSSDKILISCQSPFRKPFSTETELLFKSINILGGKLALSQKMACFSEPVDHQTKKRLESLGVEIRIVESMANENKTVNKILMLNNDLGKDYDYLITLDTDIIITKDFSEFLVGDKVRARIVGYDPLGIEIWKNLFEYFDIEFPTKRYVSLDGTETIPYFNTGVLIVPRKCVKILFDTWRHFVNKLEDAYNDLNELTKFSFFTDQIAFSLTLAFSNLDCDPLPIEMNFPIAHPSIQNSFNDKSSQPYILHHHHRISENGKITFSSNQNINSLINTVWEKVIH